MWLLTGKGSVLHNISQVMWHNVRFKRAPQQILIKWGNRKRGYQHWQNKSTRQGLDRHHDIWCPQQPRGVWAGIPVLQEKNLSLGMSIMQTAPTGCLAPGYLVDHRNDDKYVPRPERQPRCSLLLSQDAASDAYSTESGQGPSVDDRSRNQTVIPASAHRPQEHDWPGSSPHPIHTCSRVLS